MIILESYVLGRKNMIKDYYDLNYPIADINSSANNGSS